MSHNVYATMSAVMVRLAKRWPIVFPKLANAASTPSAENPRTMLRNNDSGAGTGVPGEVRCDAHAMESHTAIHRLGAPAIAHHRNTLASRLLSGKLRQTKL